MKPTKKAVAKELHETDLPCQNVASSRVHAEPIGDERMSEYEPHIVAKRKLSPQWIIEKFPNRELAMEKYQELIGQGYDLILARLVREHGEG